MASAESRPHFIRGVSAAGTDALRAIASTFAPWQLLAPIDTALDDPARLAREYLTKLKYPEHVFSQLPKAAQDRVAVAVGCPKRAAWKPAEPVAPGTPDYKKPSWEKDVYAILFAKAAAPPPAARAEVGDRHVHASAWPELASASRWKRAKGRAAVCDALAEALGAGWKAIAPAGALALPRLRATKLGLSFVAVPGGSFAMGLSPDEHRDLTRAVRGRGAEASQHVRELAKLARPVRTVKVAPFLCAETPLLDGHRKRLACEGDAANAHRVLRVASPGAAAVAKRARMRLLAEAEWEWVARSGGARAWLSGAEDGEAWAARTVASPIHDSGDAFGVLGLGWGEWVDDGWHASYEGAPKQAIAWEPKTAPEAVRGGALELWPWQVGGELVLCHAASRDRASGASAGRTAHAVRLARDLPDR